MYRLKLFFAIAFFFSKFQVKAQLPVCSANHIIYAFMQDGIYNIDLSQAAPIQSLNTTPLPPPGSFGLAVSTNLNASNPALTFYTVSGTGQYLYYDGASWVNTNHNAGTGVNIGAGGGYIYNYNIITRNVTRYDGTGDAVTITTLPSFGSVADLAVDCSGNFYHLQNQIPQAFTKYNSSGAVINVYNVTGVPVFTGGAGLIVFGNDVYYDDLSGFSANNPILHGTINGNTVNFVPTGIVVGLANDMASCPGGLASAAPLNVSICSTQLPYRWNDQNYTVPGTYTATLTNANGCDSIATLNLAVNPLITNTVDTNICSNQLPFNWNGQNYNVLGDHSVTLTAANGCDSIVTLKLTIQPEVIAFAGNDDSTQINAPYQLSGNGGLQYEWSPGPPLLNNAHIPNPVAILATNTTFSLIVKDALGCKGYDTVTIKIYKSSDIYIPSAFSPNDDGHNDLLRPLGAAIERLDYFRIFNRYGELIFESHDLSKGWDGTYKGKKQNTNAYMWVLKAMDRKKVIRTMTGNVVLIR